MHACVTFELVWHFQNVHTCAETLSVTSGQTGFLFHLNVLKRSHLFLPVRCVQENAKGMCVKRSYKNPQTNIVTYPSVLSGKSSPAKFLFGSN